jgi:methionyl-tRNA formyltransferase
MPARVVVAYTGRPELDQCRAALGEVDFVPVGSDCDIGVSIAGSHIFTVEEIDRARFGIVNLHCAPLPEFRGRYSAGHALRLGVKQFGVALHYVNEGIDTGPIIALRHFPIEDGETVEGLRAKAFAEGIELFCDWARPLVEAASVGHRLPAYRQDEARARYFDRHSIELLR